MFTRKPGLQLEKFAINSAKRLLQHNLPISDIPSPIHSITSSARASTVAGVETKRLGGLEVDHDLEFRCPPL
jgi:hypothetical protein